MARNTMPSDPYSGDSFSWTFVIFRHIPDFPGYGVDSEGNVWMCRNGSEQTDAPYAEDWQRMPGKCYTPNRPTVYLRHGVHRGQGKEVLVQRLVLEVFCGCPKPGQMSCHFPDRDPLNNRLRNLRWGTARDNASDRAIHEKGSDRLTTKNVRAIARLWKRGVRVAEIADDFGIHQSTIYRIILRQQRRGETVGILKKRTPRPYKKRISPAPN